MPEVLHRLYLNKFLPISDLKNIFNEVMKEGDKLKTTLGTSKLPKLHSRKLAYELFPEYFVTPRDQYIASFIYKASLKGFPIAVFLGEPHTAGVVKLLESPPEAIKHESILMNTLFDVDLSVKDETAEPEEEEQSDPSEITEKMKKYYASQKEASSQPQQTDLQESTEEKLEKQAMLGKPLSFWPFCFWSLG